jgi:hypothetical protein
MTVTQSLRLIGGALSALGVALALVGTAKARSALRRFRELFAPKRIHVVKATGSISASGAVLTARGRAGPGTDGWTDEQWHAELEKRIDRLATELGGHTHADLVKRLDLLRKRTSTHETSLKRTLPRSLRTPPPPRDGASPLFAFAFLGVIVQMVAIGIA